MTAKISLSDYISSVASKKLSRVEINKKVSNQHELNGVGALKQIFGRDSDKQLSFDCTFMYLSDDEDDCFSRTGHITWYDSRANNPMRSEFRLYYSYEFDDVMAASGEGDDLHLIKKHDGSLITVVCKENTSVANQVRWLFKLSESGTAFTVQQISENGQIPYASQYVLGELGITLEPPEGGDIEELLSEFQDGMPTTKVFSDYAREHTTDIDPIVEPDKALMSWMEKEEYFYRAMEHHLILEDLDKLSKEISNNNPNTPELYISGAMHYIQVRKSRAGNSFQNHIEALLKAHQIRYSVQKRTENGKIPDFIMPSIDLYWDDTFPTDRLTMLAAKRTCKERWAQILEEALRMKERHLITMEPAITTNTIDAMCSKRIQLVIPESIRTTYKDNDLNRIWNVATFLEYVKGKQVV